MNIDKLKEVAQAIELEPAAFEMTVWVEPSKRTLCGSVGCIAGTTVTLDEGWRKNHPIIQEGNEMWFDNTYDEVISAEAADMLGIDEDDANYLFTSGTWWRRACRHLGLPAPPDGESSWVSDGNISFVTAKHASTVLYALVDGTITIDQFIYDDHHEW